MISTSIFAFVLVLVVAECAALVWIIYAHRQQTRAAVSWQLNVANVCKRLRERLDVVEKTTPMALAVEVVELRDAVARLAKTQQRFQGRFDQYVHEPGPDNAPPTLTRDELRREHAASIMPTGVKRGA